MARKKRENKQALRLSQDWLALILGLLLAVLVYLGIITRVPW